MSTKIKVPKSEIQVFSDTRTLKGKPVLVRIICEVQHSDKPVFGGYTIWIGPEMRAGTNQSVVEAFDLLEEQFKMLSA